MKGSYYVSVIDGARKGLLAGPYATHKEALGMVDTVRRIAATVNSDAHWYAYGTARAENITRPGLLNHLLPAA